MYIDNVPGFKLVFPDSCMLAIVPASLDFIEHRLKLRGENKKNIEVGLGL